MARAQCNGDILGVIRGGGVSADARDGLCLHLYSFTTCLVCDPSKKNVISDTWLLEFCGDYWSFM